MLFTGNVIGLKKDSIPPGVYGLSKRNPRFGLPFKLRNIFYALFDGTVSTGDDGTRELVNGGTSAVNATLYSANGLDFDGVSQYIDTGKTLGSSEYTFLARQNIGNTSYQYLLGDSSFKSYVRLRSGSGRTQDFKLCGGSVLTVSDVELNVGDDIFVAVTTKQVGDTKELYVRLNNGEYTQSIQEVSDLDGNSVLIGYINSSNYASGVIKDVYLIPKALTAQEIAQHYANPEQTLYWENGTLKSAFLPQSTIDAMQAGNGFWYPLTENTSAGAYARNHALPYGSDGVIDSTYSTIVNYDDTMRTNVPASNKGYMPMLMPQDSFGLQSDKGLPSELYGDGRSYAQSTITMPDIYEIDFYWINDMSNGGNGLGFKVDNMFAVLASWAPGRIVWSLNGNHIQVYGQSEEYHILSLQIDYLNNSIKIFKNSNLIHEALSVAYPTRDNILQIALNGYNRKIGSVQITEGVRTDAQRLKDVTKLATKHGVTI